MAVFSRAAASAPLRGLLAARVPAASLSLSLSLSLLTSLCTDDGWLGAVCRWTKQLEGKGGLRSVVRETAGAVGDSAGAIGLSVQDSLRGLVAMRSYRLHIPPGEILLAEITIDVVAKDGTMASLLQAIRERLGAHIAHTTPHRTHHAGLHCATGGCYVAESPPWR